MSMSMSMSMFSLIDIEFARRFKSDIDVDKINVVETEMKKRIRE